MLADKIRNLWKRSTSVQTGGLESQLCMPSLNINLPLSLPCLQLFSAVINPEASGTQLVGPFPQCITHHPNLFRKFFWYIVHQPYQLIALIPADKFLCNIFGVAGIAGSSLYAAKDDFLPADGEDSAEIERDALKSRFPYSFLYIPRFFVYSCSRLSLSADLATVCPTSVFSFRRFGSFLPYLCFFFRQIQQHPALFSFFCAWEVLIFTLFCCITPPFPACRNSFSWILRTKRSAVGIQHSFHALSSRLQTSLFNYRYQLLRLRFLNCLVCSGFNWGHCIFKALCTLSIH